jgi:hypothetical protein
MTCTRTIVILGASVWFALAAPNTGHATTTCPPLASKAVTADSGISTTSTGFVNVANSHINFVQGGTKAGCVLVLFSAEAETVANEIMVVQALLDDLTPCAPDTIDFVRSNATATSDAVRAMNFVCPGVAPGPHSIRMRYLSDGGGMVELSRRTMIVQYVP